MLLLLFSFGEDYYICFTQTQAHSRNAQAESTIMEAVCNMAWCQVLAIVNNERKIEHICFKMLTFGAILMWKFILGASLLAT